MAAVPKGKGRLRGLFLLGVAVSFVISGNAQEPTPGRRLAATCASCHGTDGHGVTQSPGPLAGMPKDALVAAMKAFREGQRPSTVMGQLARGYNDEQLHAIAAFFAGEKK